MFARGILNCGPRYVCRSSLLPPSLSLSLSLSLSIRRHMYDVHPRTHAHTQMRAYHGREHICYMCTRYMRPVLLRKTQDASRLASIAITWRLRYRNDICRMFTLSTNAAAVPFPDATGFKNRRKAFVSGARLAWVG